MPRFAITHSAPPSPPRVVLPTASAWATLQLRAPWQRSLRHGPEPLDWRKIALGLGIAALLTLVEIIGFNSGMKRAQRDDSYKGSIQVSLIDPTPLQDLPEPPPPEPAPFPQRQSRLRIETPKTRSTPPVVVPRKADSSEMTGRLGAAGAPTLFGADGRVRLPETAGGSAAPATAASNPQKQARDNWQQLQERGQNPLDCHRTRFAQAFRKDQSVGDAVAGKYLKWIGLGNQAAIAKNLEERESRAAEGCDPAK